jgi:hypothetical protein
MFIGHFALGFGAKRVAPNVSLGILFLACQLADFIWPNLVLLGIEAVRIQPGATAMTPLEFTSYPYSHSLVGLVLWALAFAVLYSALARAGTRAAIVIAALVFSHWVLDVLSHGPDMPVTFGGPAKLGVGLWNHPAVAIPLELLLFAAGAWLYGRATVPVNRKGSVGLWALVLFLAAVYVANLVGPPPPSVNAVAWTVQSLWLVVAWAFWVDSNRTTRVAVDPAGIQRQ